ncbi:hypothetical protein MKW98_007633, partial [Papaver atlanticum]
MVLIESHSNPEEKDDTFTRDEVPVSADLEKDTNDGVPKIGKEFESGQQAYNCYNRYAKAIGFSIRKGSSTHRKEKTISRRVFECSN